MGSRPEAGRVGSEVFVDPDEFAVEKAEFELGVGEENATRFGVGRGATIDFESDSADLVGEWLADDLRGTFEGNVFVVTADGFGGGSKDRFGQLVGFAKTSGKLDAADCAVRLIFLPSGAGEIAARDAFDGKRMRFANDHGASREFVQMLVEGGGKFGGGEDVVRHDVAKKIEPEERELREDAALVGDGSGHDDIEGGEAIGSDEEEAVAEIVNVAHFAASGRRYARKIRFTNNTSCRDCGHGKPSPEKVWSILAQRRTKSM